MEDLDHACNARRIHRKRAWYDYCSGNHQSHQYGYAADDIAADAAEDMAHIIARWAATREWDHKHITLVACDASSAVLAGRVLPHFRGSSMVLVPKHGYKLNKDWRLNSWGDVHPGFEEDHHLVMVDDYLHTGRAIRKVARMVRRPLDLYLCIQHNDSWHGHADNHIQTLFYGTDLDGKTPLWDDPRPAAWFWCPLRCGSGVRTAPIKHEEAHNAA